MAVPPRLLRLPPGRMRQARMSLAHGQSPARGRNPAPRNIMPATPSPPQPLAGSSLLQCSPAAGDCPGAKLIAARPTARPAAKPSAKEELRPDYASRSPGGEMAHPHVLSHRLSAATAQRRRSGGDFAVRVVGRTLSRSDLFSLLSSAAVLACCRRK